MALFGMGMKQILEEIKTYLEEENYEAAAEAADRVSVNRVKTASEFNLLGKAYKKNEDYLQAKEMFERSYAERCSRVTLLDLMDCCLETGELEEAEKWFDEYHRISPEDKTTLYVYRYKIEKRKGREKRLLLAILEELKAVEYLEEYAYELAKVYHKLGMAEECMNECRDIILWFGAGATVERAKALLAYYKGEFSLEDIKNAGERYLARRQEEGEDDIEPEYAEEEAQPEYEEPSAEEFGNESPEEYEEEVFEEEQEALEDTEELPEIDLSGLGFSEQEAVPDQNQRGEDELFEPFYVLQPVTNAKLARLLSEKKVSLLEEMKNFERMEQVHKQLVKSLELVLTDKEKAYFVVTGEKKTGKTTFAFAWIRLLYRLGIVKYDRTATINAVQLNQINMEDYREQLTNCNLIVENAGGMTQEAVEAVLRFSKGRKGSICVILEDSTRSINKFLRGREDLNGLFNNRIHLGKYSTKDLLGFAFDYIKKEDYGIDKMAAEILSNKIDEIVRNYGDEERLLKTLELAADAIARADRRNSEVLLGMAMEGRFREGNYLVIIAEDVDD